MSARHWRWVGVAAVLLALAAALGWRLQPPAVPAVAVQAAPLRQTLLFSARVAAPQRVELGATLTARVQQVQVAEGATVKAGALLVQLEDAEPAAALAQAQAAERQAMARLQGLRSTGRRGAQAAQAQAEATRLAAETELRRTQELVRQGFLSPARLDDAQRALAVAQAQSAAAQAQGAALDDQGSDVAQAEAALAVARAATQAAAARLAQTRLRAPADATVLVRAVEPGQIVQPGRALLTLALAGGAQLEAAVDERYLQQLRPGQAAQVRADAFPAQRFAAQVARIAPQVDAQRGAVQVELVVPAPPPFLREDMSLSVEVVTGQRERALVLPLAALRAEPRGNDGSGGSDGTAETATVWVLADGRVAERRVTLGLRTLQAVEVLTGLQPGETVLLGSAAVPGQRARADFSAAPSAGAGGGDAAASLSGAMGR